MSHAARRTLSSRTRITCWLYAFAVGRTGPEQVSDAEVDHDKPDQGDEDDSRGRRGESVRDEDDTLSDQSSDGFHLSALRETIVSTDPFEARFTFTADGDSITVTVDDSLSVVDASRGDASEPLR